MLDKQGRLTLGKELIEEAFGQLEKREVNLFFDVEAKVLHVALINKSIDVSEDYYFLKREKMDPKGRIGIPISIRKTFPDAKFLPAMKNGKLYILIV